MKRIGEHMKEHEKESAKAEAGLVGFVMPKKTRITERGELMRYFTDRLNAGRSKDRFERITMSRMGKILQGIPTKDLYYLQRVCKDSKDFSKKFWYELDPKKHTPEYQAKLKNFSRK